VNAQVTFSLQYVEKPSVEKPSPTRSLLKAPKLFHRNAKRKVGDRKTSAVPDFSLHSFTKGLSSKGLSFGRRSVTSVVSDSSRSSRSPNSSPCSTPSGSPQESPSSSPVVISRNIPASPITPEPINGDGGASTISTVSTISTDTTSSETSDDATSNESKDAPYVKQKVQAAFLV